MPWVKLYTATSVVPFAAHVSILEVINAGPTMNVPRPSMSVLNSDVNIFKS